MHSSTSLRCPGLLFQLVTLITISITAGLKCSSCLDVSGVKVLGNTVPGFSYTLDLKTYSSPNCDTAVNGEYVSGVTVTTCNNNPVGSQVYACVKYNGQVIANVTVNTGGEVSVIYQGTYRNCMLVDDSTKDYCVNEDVPLREGNQLRRDLVALLPVTPTYVSVVFQGQKCVLYGNGTAAVKKSCVYVVLLFLFVYFFVCKEDK